MPLRDTYTDRRAQGFLAAGDIARYHYDHTHRAPPTGLADLQVGRVDAEKRPVALAGFARNSASCSAMLDRCTDVFQARLSAGPSGIAV
jgi:hypothetical protein